MSLPPPNIYPPSHPHPDHFIFMTRQFDETAIIKTPLDLCLSLIPDSVQFRNIIIFRIKGLCKREEKNRRVAFE